MNRLTTIVASLLILAASPAAALDAPAVEGTVRPLVEAFRITLQPGWEARCETSAGTGGSIAKSTRDEQGVVLRAVIEGGEPAAYGVQLYLDNAGKAADVDVFEVAGHAISDEAYFELRNAAASWVPEAEFAGKMSDEIAATQQGGAGTGDPGQAMDLNLAVRVEGLQTLDGEDYLVVRRDGILSGKLHGEEVTIRFAALVRVHRASGLIAEEVMHTEVRSAGTNPRRQNSRTACAIVRSD